MSRTIIVSDLHVDTWTDRLIGDTGKTKKQHFFEFLDACELNGVTEFVINGDLMDLPPYEGQCAFQTDIAREVVERIIAFAANVKVKFVFGNHDIGISGFRSEGADSIEPLKQVGFFYPDCVLERPKSTILVTHGQVSDFFKWLYSRDLYLRTYSARGLNKYHWRMRPRDLQPRGPRKPPGILAPRKPEPGQHAYAALESKRARAPRSAAGVIWGSIVEWVKSIARGPTSYWFALCGKREMFRYIARQQASNRELQPRLYIVMGHTHLADAPVSVRHKGIWCRYLNSGSWTEESDTGHYLDVDSTGKVWIQEWINEPDHYKRMDKRK